MAALSPRFPRGRESTGNIELAPTGWSFIEWSPNLRKWLVEHPKLVRFLTKMTPFFAVKFAHEKLYRFCTDFCFCRQIFPAQMTKNDQTRPKMTEKKLARSPRGRFGKTLPFLYLFFTNFILFMVKF